MLRRLLHRLILRRHFWREAGFDELTELYISNMLRMFALSLLTVFLPFYLHQNGYSFSGIFAYYGLFFAGRIFSDIAAGYFTARFGPKHSIALSCVLQVIGTAMLLTLPQHHWPSIVTAPVFGAAASFFFIAFHVEFSKIKHPQHAGRELGEMQMFERAAAVCGPLIGGLVGTFWEPRYIFAVACGILFLSIWPLFTSPEQVRIRQRLRFDSLPLERLRYDLASYVGLGLESTLYNNLWPMYLALFALSGAVYAKLGMLSSLAVVTAMVAAYFFGKHIDKKNARSLLRSMATLNALTYVWRPLVVTPLAAFLTNLLDETATTGYRMAYMKGMYAAADDLPGDRIAYVTVMEWLATATKGTVWFILAILANGVPGRLVVTIGFAFAGIGSLMITSERFKAFGVRK